MLNIFNPLLTRNLPMIMKRSPVDNLRPNLYNKYTMKKLQNYLPLIIVLTWITLMTILAMVLA
jgi:hypothetical protein